MFKAVLNINLRQTGSSNLQLPLFFPGRISGIMKGWIEEKDGCVVLNVRVTPRAANDAVVGVMDGKVLKIRIQAPPVDGKANAYLVRYLSGLWNIPRSEIEILSGKTGRGKRVRINNPPRGFLRQLESIDSA